MNGPSQHLSWSELACHDGAHTPYPMEWRVERAIVLADEFEAIRKLCGDRPLVVLSGYRTSDWNRRVGGVPASQHVRGRALDIRCPGKSVEWLENRVRLRIYTPGSAIHGLGLYPSFVHVDIRPGTRLATWHGTRPKADAVK
jgi:uncharacterized protein YcbK (DUF882 family)